MCPHVAEGCGGCDLATLAHAAQLHAKVEIVADGLRRLGRWHDPVVRAGPSLDPWGFRTTLRLAITNGRAGLRRAASNAVVELDHCAVAHPLLDELVADGEFGAATEVMLRVGAATGERIAVCTPIVTASACRMTSGWSAPTSSRRASAAWIHEVVAGRRWRISADSFFQTRPDGAAALVDVVTALAADMFDTSSAEGERHHTLLDAYSGVGLFAGQPPRRSRRLAGRDRREQPVVGCRRPHQSG